MRYLFFSPSAASAGVAYRVQEEGNDVDLYIAKPFAKTSLAGIVPQVKTLAEGLEKNPDVIVFDMVGYGAQATALRKRGYKVIGSGSEYQGKSFQDEIELDRSFGMKIMQSGGITVPETTEWKGSDIEKASKFVKESGKRFVIKPDDNVSADATYVAESADDMLGHFEYIKKHKLIKPSDEFVLQEFKEGIEISTEQWFSEGKPIYPANGTMETKKFMVGNLGPNTGCSTSLCWFYEKREPKILQTTIKKIHILLEKVKYTGPLDINCIVHSKDKKPYGLEWTARMGYSAIYALIRLLKGDIAEALYLIANGQMEEFEYRKGFGYSVRATIPPYPLSIQDEKLRNQIYRETAGKRYEFKGKPECIFPTEIMKVDGELVTAGIDGEIAEITGYGDSIEAAKNEAHSQFKLLQVPNKQARLDGWKRPLKELPILKSWGFEVPDVGTVKDPKKKGESNG